MLLITGALRIRGNLDRVRLGELDGLFVGLDQPVQDLAGGEAAKTHRHIEIVQRGQRVAAVDRLQELGLIELRPLEAQALGFFFQHVAALGHVLVLELVLEPGADF